ncbi:MAG: hypothetical protein WC329_03510, partial [Candidatus Omnitrophota bacterium]
MLHSRLSPLFLQLKEEIPPCVVDVSPAPDAVKTSSESLLSQADSSVIRLPLKQFSNITKVFLESTM